MQNKKILSTLIIAILTFSMIFAFIPTVSAITIVLDPTFGPVGTKVKVSGIEASLGGLTEVYWETTAPEKLLNTTYAKGDGTYECNVTIPDDVQGLHYVIVRDVSTGTTAATQFTINPEIELAPTSGLPDDSIAVAGTGFAANENVTSTFEGPITNETIDATPNGTKFDFSGTLDYYPIKGGTLEINATVGGATVLISDDGAGVLSGENVTGTIDYDTGEWVLNFTINAPDDDTVITANYNIEFDITSSPPPKTSALGSFSSSFAVPTVPYGSYFVNATDETGNFNATAFNVTATITLMPDKGPTGTVVATTGRGFTETADVNVTITVGGVTAPQVAPIKTKADGTFTGQFIVPTVIVAVHDVVASDGTISATKSFNVTETTAITLDPTAGQPDWEITIEGLYFTAITNTEVTVKIDGLTVKTLYTNATGGFKGTFIPGMPPGSYTVTATDAKGLEATASFTVAITLIVLTPTEGTTGINVKIMGYGFTLGGTANVTIGDKLVLMNIDVTTELHVGINFTVPTLPAATYTVTATDDASLSFSTSFKVTKSTELILKPSSAPAGYNVTIVGNYFSGLSTVDVVLYNATEDESFGPFSTLANGTFTGTFLVPDWTLDDYYINATDSLTFPDTLKLIRLLEVPFKIERITIQMYTRVSEYLQGDTVSFYIKCTFAGDTTIKIKDPTEYPYGSISIATTEWEPLGDFHVVPYNKTLVTLPSDAKTGTWNWTATIGTETETDTFSVVARPTLTAILEKLDDLDATLVSLDGTVATIDSNVGEIKVSVAEINLKVVAINGTVATIETDLGTMQGTITSIDDNVATIQTDVGTVKADVSDIVETGVTIDLTPVWIAVAFSILAFLAATAAAYMLRSKLA